VKSNIEKWGFWFYPLVDGYRNDTAGREEERDFRERIKKLKSRERKRENKSRRGERE